MNFFLVPTELSILIKEHFNRWYSLRTYFVAVTLVDIPISVFSCGMFSVIIYLMSGQPLEIIRFGMFLAISILTVFVAQSFGLMIGAVFDVVVSVLLKFDTLTTKKIKIILIYLQTL